jgi:antitoxin ParD1/3/4
LAEAPKADMSRYRLTPQAEADLFEIWCYIARDSIRVADKVEAAIHRACELAAQAPLGGRERRDLTTRPLRFWTVPRYHNYLIVYDPSLLPVQVIRILHGARNVPAILEEG